MNVNLRVITQKEEADLEEGTILSQTPAAGTKIKAHQSLYVVIAKKPENKKAPSIIRMKKDAIQTLCNKQDMQVKYYNLASNWPKGTCFAQWPPQDHPLDTNQLIAYISSPTNKPIIWPNLKNKPLGDVIAFLQEHGIEPTVTHTYAHAHSQIPPNALVVDQRPLAGTILTLDDSKPLSVQLRVQ
jgi:beta-lactam-binding protein with PASTA domain